MKKRLVLLGSIMLMMAFLLAGCGSGGGGTSDSGQSEETAASESARPAFDLSQIEWNVESGIVDGVRVVTFGYTNNTDYEVVDFDLEFKVKGDVTSEQLEQYSELREKAESMEHDIGEITFQCMTSKCVKPGESIDGQPCGLDGTIEYYTDFDSYEVFEPDMMTAVLSDGKKLYSAYYDFSSQKTTVDEDVMDAYTWSNSALAKAVPKPDVRYLAISYENEDSLYAEAYGVSRDACGEYIDACKAMGFKQNIDDSDETYGASGTRYFSADNGEGIKVDVDFYPGDDEMQINVNREGE